jgi:hypothetical protein
MITNYFLGELTEDNKSIKPSNSDVVSRGLSHRYFEVLFTLALMFTVLNLSLQIESPGGENFSRLRVRSAIESGIVAVNLGF